MTYNYKTKGTCSREIILEIDGNGIVEDVTFIGGCNGNLKGIASLVKGMHKDEVIDRLKDIKCGYKNTSCPAQLALALEEIG